MTRGPAGLGCTSAHGASRLASVAAALLPGYQTGAEQSTCAVPQSILVTNVSGVADNPLNSTAQPAIPGFTVDQGPTCGQAAELHVAYTCIPCLLAAAVLSLKSPACCMCSCTRSLSHRLLDELALGETHAHMVCRSTACDGCYPTAPFYGASFAPTVAGLTGYVYASEPLHAA